MCECPHCDRSFESSRGLKLHSKKAHGKPAFTQDDITDFIRRLSKRLEGKPTSRDLNGEKYSLQNVLEYFDSWNSALEASGITPHSYRPAGPGRGKGPQRTRQDAIDAIQDYYNRFGEVPTRRDFDEHSEMSGEVIRKRLFGSWNEALREAGFEINAAPVGERDGELNPQYVDGSSIGGLDYGDDWQEQRQRCLERDDYKCRSCGMGEEEHKEKFGKGLDVHHVVPLRNFDDPKDANSLGNLVTACKRCHRRYEGLPVFPE